MINKRKVRLMARTAMYEANEGHTELKYANYYRGDYVGKHMVFVAVGITVSYFIALLILCVYNYEYIIGHLTMLDYRTIESRAIVSYVLILLASQVIAYLVFSARFSDSVTGVKFYLNRLKKIEKLNEEDRLAAQEEYEEEE